MSSLFSHKALLKLKKTIYTVAWKNLNLSYIS